MVYISIKWHIFLLSCVQYIFFVWALIVAHLATSRTTGPDGPNGAFIRLLVLEATSLEI